MRLLRNFGLINLSILDYSIMNFFKFIIILVVVIIVAVVAVAGFVVWFNSSDLPRENDVVYCTMEAKLCSDGSYVGRTGSKCEFALCPKEDLIRILSPMANEEISSPLAIKGEARGYWFFEASFPIVLVDWDGRIIAQAIATAEKEWMTEDFVPFTAELSFEKPEFIRNFSKRGALILQKDNPSGLSEHDDALEIPIVFR